MTISSFTGEYRFLSNFWPADVVLDGVHYSSVEHAYQAAKTSDIKQREIVASSDTPGKAKRAGKMVTKRADWDQVKFDVMLDLLRQKFHITTSLFRRLALTAPHDLVEGNTWGDVVWGVCNGQGQNMLGKMLMQVRDDL